VEIREKEREENEIVEEEQMKMIHCAEFEKGKKEKDVRE
jgi:hypothetical protein